MEGFLTILGLPNEVLGLIISDLSTNDKTALRCTCKRLDTQVMRHLRFYPELNDANVDAVFRIQYPITRLRVSDLTPRRAYFVRRLSAIADSITRLTFRHNLITGRVISLLNYSRILRVCSNVTDLAFSGTVLGQLPIEIGFFHSISVTLPKLEKLTIGFAGVRDRGILFSALSVAIFPHLRFLKIWIGEWGQKNITLMEYFKITQFVAGRWQTLKFLEIDDQGSSSKRSTEETPSVPSAQFLENLGKIQLESLELRYFGLCFISNTSNLFSTPAFLGAQRSLRVLSLDIVSNDLWNQIKLMIANNCSTLESFGIGSARRDGHSFDCSIVSNCHKLKSLFLLQRYRPTNLNMLPQSIQNFCWNFELTRGDVYTFQRHLINLKCLHFGERCEFPSSKTTRQMIKIPSLKTIRLHSEAQILTLSEIVFPGTSVTYFTRYASSKGVNFIVGQK